MTYSPQPPFQADPRYEPDPRFAPRPPRGRHSQPREWPPPSEARPGQPDAQGALSPQGPVTYDEPPRHNPSANVPPAPHAKLRGVWLYLAILATVYVVASLGLGVLSYAAMQNNARKVEQLQTDTNDNLCNQQAYQGGTTCQGGDANGGSFLP
jgi:hypothetical protein